MDRYRSLGQMVPTALESKFEVAVRVCYCSDAWITSKLNPNTLGVVRFEDKV
jgi:hypothetical protein